MKEPTMTEIEREATGIVGSFIKAARNESVDIPAALCVGLYDHIRMTLTRLSRPPAGFVRDEHGVDRRVLGVLPVTADGAVCGHGAIVSFVCRRSHGVGRKRTVWIRQVVNRCEHIAQWYSSVEAAEAAAAKERGE